MKVLIADDEPEAVELVSSMLEEFPFVEVTAKTCDPKEARELMKTQPFDTAFLDIEYPGYSAFDLLEGIEKIPRVVFISAHDKYALKAIKHHAFDYLLKPIDPDEFQEVVERIGRENDHPVGGEEYIAQIQKLLAPSKDHRIAIPTQHGYVYHRPDEIVRVEASGSYTKVFLGNTEMILVSRNLKDFEKALLPKGFIRVHRSHLVNVNFVQGFSRIDGGTVEMTDGLSFHLSKKYRDSAIQELQKCCEKI